MSLLSNQWLMNQWGRAAKTFDPDGGPPKYGLVNDFASADWIGDTFQRAIEDVGRMLGTIYDDGTPRRTRRRRSKPRSRPLNPKARRTGHPTRSGTYGNYNIPPARTQNNYGFQSGPEWMEQQYWNPDVAPGGMDGSGDPELRENRFHGPSKYANNWSLEDAEQASMFGGGLDWQGITNSVGNLFDPLFEGAPENPTKKQIEEMGIPQPSDRNTNGWLQRISEMGENATNDIGRGFMDAAEDSGYADSVESFLAPGGPADNLYAAGKSPFVAMRKMHVEGRKGAPASDLLNGEFWQDVWQESHEMSAGQAIGDTMLLREGHTPQEINYIRKHDAAYNLVSGSIDVVFNWKAAPEVLGARLLGVGRGFRRGEIPVSWRTKGPPGSKEKFRNATLDALMGKGYRGGAWSPSGQMGHKYGQNLLSRVDQLKDQMQKVRNGQLGFERIASLHAYKDNPALAYAHMISSGDDELWDLTWRASLGDGAAYQEIRDLSTDAAAGGRFPELAERFPKAQSWRDALRANSRRIRSLDDDVLDLQRQLAGRTPKEQAQGYYNYNTWLLETDIQVKSARLAEAKEQLAGYEGYDEWLRAATEMPGGQPLGSVSKGMGKSALTRESFWDTQDARAHEFYDNPYGRRHKVIRMARAPFLKKPGIIDLHSPTESYDGLRAYFDQLQAITGYNNAQQRSMNLQRFASLQTDVERRKFLEGFELGVVSDAFAHKYGVAPGTVEKILGRMSEKKNYVLDSIEKQSDGSVFQMLDDEGNLLDIKLPVSTTELRNYYMTLDAQRLDSVMKHDTEFVRELDSAFRRRGHETAQEVIDWVDKAGARWNAFWKPLVLLRFGYTTRVVPDEAMRVMAQTAAIPYLQNVGKSVGHSTMNRARHIGRAFIKLDEKARPRQFDIGPGPLTDEVVGPRLVGRDWDVPVPEHLEAPAKPVNELLANPVPGRLEELQAKAAERNFYHRQVDKFRAYEREFAEGRTSTAPAPVEAPEWAAKYQGSLNYAKQNNSGFTFDPARDTFQRNGWAVKSFPDRTLAIPEDRMGPQWINYFMEQNVDVLNQRGSRIAVSFNEGAYHLDVVRHFSKAKMQDALEYGAKTEADGIVDVGNRFQEFGRQQVYSDNTLPRDVETTDFAFREGASMVDDPMDFQVRTPEAAELRPHDGETFVDELDPKENKVRDWFFRDQHMEGKAHMWRDRHGNKLNYEPLYSDDGRVYMTLNSGQPAWANLWGQGRTGAKLREGMSKYKEMKPPAPGQANRAEYYHGWAKVVNTHMRYDPIWRRMLNGQSDDEILDWFRQTQQGRQVLRRMPHMGPPEKRVELHRQLLNQYLPSYRLQGMAAKRDLTVRDLTDGIRPEHRPTIHIDNLDAVQGGPIAKAGRAFVNQAYNFLANLPDNMLVRHPFAATMYNLKMRNFIAQQDGPITQQVLEGAQREARQFANRQIKRTLFNLADESNFLHFNRFMLPFANATFETITRWARIGMDHPESLVHMAQAWDALNELPKGAATVIEGGEYDKDGAVFKLGRFEYGPKDTVVVSVPDWMKKGIEALPGIPKGALDHVGKVGFTKGQLNMVFQGDMAGQAFIPSTNPLVGLTLDQMLRVRDDEGLLLEGNWLYDWFFPVGRPEKGPSALKSILPAYLRRAIQWYGGEGDRVHNNLILSIGNDLDMQYRKGLRPKPTLAEVKERANKQMQLRTIVSFFTPAQLTYKSPNQFYIDQYRDMIDKYGPMGADEKFLKKYGEDYFAFTQSLSNSEIGIPATKKGLKDSLKFKDLIGKYPDFGSMIVSPQAYKDEFDPDIYKHQFNQKIRAGSPRTVRSQQSFQDRYEEMERSLGWTYYMAASSAVDAELAKRGLTSLNSSGAEDIAQWKTQFRNEVMEQLPAWGVDYTESIGSSIGAKMDQLRGIAFDKRMKHRADMAGLRHYLTKREEVAQYLNQNYANGGSRNLQADENSDIREAWNGWVAQLKERNPMFADMHTRWLDSDTMESGGGI